MQYNTNLNCDISTEIKRVITDLRIDQVVSPTLPTDQSAFYLNRQSQTLRARACLENGPIRPIRINGRLAWPVGDMRRLLQGGRDE